MSISIFDLVKYTDPVFKCKNPKCDSVFSARLYVRRGLVFPECIKCGADWNFSKIYEFKNINNAQKSLK